MVSLGNSASILLQKVSIDMKHFSGGQNVLELSHSVLNVLDRLHVLSTYLISQLSNISVDDQQKLYYAIAGQIGTALGIYSNKLSMSAISTSTSPLPIAAVTALAAVVGSSVVYSLTIIIKLQKRKTRFRCDMIQKPSLHILKRDPWLLFLVCLKSYGIAHTLHLVLLLIVLMPWLRKMRNRGLFSGRMCLDPNYSQFYARLFSYACRLHHHYTGFVLMT